MRETWGSRAEAKKGLLRATKLAKQETSNAVIPRRPGGPALSPSVPRHRGQPSLLRSPATGVTLTARYCSSRAICR